MKKKEIEIKKARKTLKQVELAELKKNIKITFYKKV